MGPFLFVENYYSNDSFFFSILWWVFFFPISSLFYRTAVVPDELLYCACRESGRRMNYYTVLAVLYFIYTSILNVMWGREEIRWCDNAKVN